MDARLFQVVFHDDVAAFHTLLAEDPLLLHRVALNSIDNPLHISSLAGNIAITKDIVLRKPEFAGELNQQGFSPMHIASANGHVEIVRELLNNAGVDVCLLKGKDGKLPLHCAVIKGRVDVVRVLVFACKESLAQVTVQGETALHLAVKNNQLEVVRVLLEEMKRLDMMMEVINCTDKKGNTVLHLATLGKQHETIGMLIAEDAIATGVDVNSVNSSGFTPKDVLELMLQSGDESSLYDLVEMFHHAGALKSGEMIATNQTLTACHRNDQAKYQHPDANPPSRTIPSSSSRLSKIWKELTKEIEESSMESQNALMVVAVLIATITYQAMLSPPSGILSPEKRTKFGTHFTRRYVAPGEAAMANDPEVFALFTVFNGIGFIASIGIISLLSKGFPLRAGLRLAMLSMTATFVIGVFYIAPTNDGTVYVVAALMGVGVFVEFALFMLWLLRK
ncbi:ankyrin repeat-containing protein BDA1-like [Juglans microcarpa x Juglans regia]|uniref:ankyrin repeat-containing protein BDA1-like n=1 Tax=Juglans microcarpa x Juglans regia TaxID=2249226 RepID=UPI001B7F01F9|nr:ankyrin repeat-containing protein BDA1-like [Juglans microcarpa x Juglans regia]